MSSPSEVLTDDASLLAASRRGDVEAFGQLVERYHNLVTAIAYSRTGDRAISEDIAQETFLVAWADVARVRDPNKLRAWLCGIARNLSGKTLRRRRREHHEDTEQLDARAGRDSGPLSSLISKETEASVWAALEQLSPAYREPLVLFYREDQSIKQVADGLGLSEQTAKQRLSRGRVSLKQNLELVEQTVASGRPRKAAVAAVLAALALSAKTTPAVAATKPVKWKLAAAGVLAAASIGIGVVAIRSSARTSEAAATDHALIAQLKQARDTARAKSSVQTCALRGIVTRSDRAPAADVLVASISHSWHASSFEPVITETDARGHWTLAVPPGRSTLSVTSAGQRAQARVVTCTPASTEQQAFVLDTAGTTLRGSITDVGGGAIAGATIWITQPQVPDIMFVTRSDARGAYEVRVHPDAYAVMLRHPDYTLDMRPVAVGDAGAREDFALLPAASIEGVVVDASGTPVPSARIHFAPAADSPWALASTYGGLLPYAADANGRFVVRGVPPGTVKLSARTQSLATVEPTSVDVALAEMKTNVTVTVGTARTISGFIVARGGREGLADIQVAVAREELPLGLPFMTSTDASGYFELAGLPPGPYRLSAIGAGFVPHVAEQSITVTDRDVGDMLVRLDRGVALRGRFEPAVPVVLKLQPTDAKDPLAWVRATLTRAEVDDRGNFSFPAVAPGRYVITATAYDRHGELPVTVANADQLQLRIPLASRPTITGEVVDDTGKPLVGALVAVTTKRTDPFAMLVPALRTDERGKFKIMATAGARYGVRVFDDRGQRPWANEKRPFKVVSLEPGSEEKLVVVSGTGVISGVAVGADRQPIADAWIEVRARDARDYPVFYRPAPVATDAAGRFSIAGLVSTDFVVEATNGHLKAVTPARSGDELTLELHPRSKLIGQVAGTQEVEVELRSKVTDRRQRQRATGSFEIAAVPGEHELVVTSATGYSKSDVTIARQPTRVDVVLTPWASVRGKVVGPDGKPWVNASILVREDLQPSRTKTDSAGNFVLDRMIAGRNEITVFHGGVTDSADVHIELAPGQQLDLETIEGRTINPDADIDELRRAIEPKTTASTSVELGLQFFVAATPPSDATLARVARDPLLAYRGRKDPNAALWIVAVTPDGPGARAGLRRGDRVIAVGTRKTGTGEEAAAAGMSFSTRWRSRGRAVRWTVQRDGHELAVDVLVPD